MKRGILWVGALLLIPALAQANGVAVVDASRGIYLQLMESHVRVAVENQIAVVRTRQRFHNQLEDAADIKYAFPLPAGASVTHIQWVVNGREFTASVIPKPQDNTLPGSASFINFDLLSFLGRAPILLDIEEEVDAGATIEVDLTYVERLPYALGEVTFRYPAAYDILQANPIDMQSFSLDVTSQRTIDSIEAPDIPNVGIQNLGFFARVASRIGQASASFDYEVRYRLNPEAFGLFGSSALYESALDEEGPGFFLFVAEPDPTSTADALQKRFTLMVDQSGSMEGEKMEQAKRASRFIIENLNPDDRFNVVAFRDDATRAFETHQPNTPDHVATAVAFIEALQPAGATDFAVAFSEALAQFGPASDSTAHIILFFTDGRASAGLTDTDDLLRHVRALKAANQTDAAIFALGIGPEVDRGLVTRLALEHEGLVEFLEPHEVETGVAAFYSQIQNPVLLNPTVSFSSGGVASVYPQNVPNLYRGQQLLLAGRYRTPGPLTVTLEGRAFGKPITFTYDAVLADSVNEHNQVLPQVWAKLKIESLLVQYYTLERGSAAANLIRDQVIDVSVTYGIQSPFTTFELRGDGVVATGTEDADEDLARVLQGYTLHGAYPNPFTTETTIRLDVAEAAQDVIFVKVYNAMGQLVRTLTLPVAGPGLYTLDWDGTTDAGHQAPAGTYYYVVQAKQAVLSGSVTLIR